VRAHPVRPTPVRGLRSAEIEYLVNQARTADPKIFGQHFIDCEIDPHRQLRSSGLINAAHGSLCSRRYCWLSSYASRRTASGLTNRARALRCHAADTLDLAKWAQTAYVRSSLNPICLFSEIDGCDLFLLF
jgi:hypothetical protein